MQHTKKMVLVSPETLSSVQDKIQDRPVSSVKTTLTRLDQELKQILDRHDLPPFDKVQLYNQTLQRYLTYYNQSVKKPITINVTRDKTLTDHDMGTDPIDIPPNQEEESLEGAVGGLETETDAEKVLMNFPATLMSKAKTLLGLVKNSGGILDYNKHGELISDGKVVPGSHISDVLYDVLLGKKDFEPRGWEQFLGGLIRMNVPERMVTNSNRRFKMIKMKQQQQGSTPPGSTEFDHFTSPPTKKTKSSKKSRVSKTTPYRTVKGRLNWSTYPSL